MDEIYRGFGDRIKTMAVYAPIFELNQKTKYPYPLPSLAVSVLLFVLEDMVRMEKNCTYEALAYHLRDLITQYMQEPVGYHEAMEFTHFLVRQGLMNSGRPHEVEYWDVETGETRVHKFHLLEFESYDMQTKTVRLKLTNEGVEMLFKTKEIYGELQVTIAQLYLRQQIQKGVFDGALRAVEELALAVRNEKHRLAKLEERIIKDVLQVAREKELERQHERIDEQLEQEQQVFGELAQLIEYTIDQYQAKELTTKEEKAISSIIKIRRRLFDVIHDHESLFKEKLRIHQVMIRSVESRILASFTTKINFETEFLLPVVQRDLKIDGLKKILDPILPMRRPGFFHPGRVFMEQPLRGSQEEGPSEAEVWAIEEEKAREEESLERARQREKEAYLERYLNLLLFPLLERPQCKVGEILDRLAQEEPQEYQEMVGRMDFYSFLIQLHQMGEIPLKTSQELDLYVLDDLPRVLVSVVEANHAIHSLGSFWVEATSEVLRLPSGYVISEFVIRRQD